MKKAKGFCICGVSRCIKQFNSEKTWIKHLLKKHRTYYYNHRKDYFQMG